MGLSADTNLASRIGQLDDYTFLTNSDSHSPWPHRIAREFNKIQLDDISYDSLCSAIINNQIVENILYIDSYKNIEDKYMLMITSNAYAKLVLASEYEKYRATVKATKISEDDKLILVTTVSKDNLDKNDLAVFTSDSYVLKFTLSNIPVVKKEAQGIKCIALNKTAKKSLVEIAVGPVAVIALGILLNILFMLGLFTPAA